VTTAYCISGDYLSGDCDSSHLASSTALFSSAKRMASRMEALPMELHSMVVSWVAVKDLVSLRQVSTALRCKVDAKEEFRNWLRNQQSGCPLPFSSSQLGWVWQKLEGCLVVVIRVQD
jgi:hypothetical protein